MITTAIETIERRIAALDHRDWVRLVLGVAGLALVARLVTIAATGGGFNLRIFHYFGQLIVAGVNPYDAPSGGEFAPAYGDNAPPELLLFAGLLEIHDSATTLRIFFALVDSALISYVGLAYPRSRSFRLNFIIFYGFNPLLLEAWTGFADDKSLLLLLTIGVLVGLQTARPILSWTWAALLGVVKWYSVVFAPILAIESARRRSWRWAAVALAVFGLVIASAQLPYFPDSLDAFARRNNRIDIDPPIHAAVTQLLAEAGIYSSLVPRLFVPVALALVYLLRALRRIDSADAVVLSIFCAYVALPDEGFNRMLLITLPFLFVITMSRLRWLLVWVSSTLAAAAVLVEFRDFHFAPVESLFGAYGSLRHVIFVNVVMAVVVALYLRDRLRGRSLVGSTSGPH